MITSKKIQRLLTVISIISLISCTASKEYTSKIFQPRSEDTINKSVAKNTNLKFLEQETEVENRDMIDTQILTGNKNDTITLDAIAINNKMNTDSIAFTKKNMNDKKSDSINQQVVVIPKAGGVRNKKTRNDF